MQTALILIDIQKDYFPGGAMEVSGAEDAAKQAAVLLSTFRRKSLPVLHVQHISSRPGATFFLPNTPGVEIHDLVRPLPDEPVFKKNYPNSFRCTNLQDYLQQQGITDLVIAGMMTHMCIDTTTRAAADLGFACTLAHDACATRSLTFEGKQISAADVQIAFIAALNGLFAKADTAREIANHVLGKQ